MTITVHYYAMLREQAGRRSETRETQAATAAALYAELQAIYGFTLPVDRIRVALGTAYADNDCPLRDGLEITFIPPVAGG